MSEGQRRTWSEDVLCRANEMRRDVEARYLQRREGQKAVLQTSTSPMGRGLTPTKKYTAVGSLGLESETLLDAVELDLHKIRTNEVLLRAKRSNTAAETALSSESPPRCSIDRTGPTASPLPPSIYVGLQADQNQSDDSLNALERAVGRSRTMQGFRYCCTCSHRPP